MKKTFREKENYRGQEKNVPGQNKTAGQNKTISGQKKHSGAKKTPPDRKLADLCASELSAAQVGSLLTFVDRSAVQRKSELSADLPPSLSLSPGEQRWHTLVKC